MTDLSIFAFESAAVRTLTRNGEPWFVATDIANILGFKHSPHMVRMLDEDEKGVHVVDTLGGDQELSVISESGLYACILKSRRAEAKVSRKWVTSDVLPAIRKTGTFFASAYQLTRDDCKPSHVRLVIERDVFDSKDRRKMASHLNESRIRHD